MPRDKMNGHAHGNGGGTSASGSPDDISIGFQHLSTSDLAPSFPSFFISHGAGPSFFLDAKDYPKFAEVDKHSEAAQFLRSFQEKQLEYTPAAILVISAHWETDSNEPLEVTFCEENKLMYDYYGFPRETYAPNLTYSCHGCKNLARRVKHLLELGMVNAPSLSVKFNSQRGLDHGAFIPLKLMFPEADVPVVQLSIKKNLSPSLHLAIGAMLSPLRADHVLILGSGQATHSLSDLGKPNAALSPWAEEFREWLRDTLTVKACIWASRLLKWERAPHARRAHPREEHLIPLMVAAGAADPYSVKLALRPSKEGGGSGSKIAPTVAVSPKKSHLKGSVIHDGYALESLLTTSFRFD